MKLTLDNLINSNNQHYRIAIAEALSKQNSSTVEEKHIIPLLQLAKKKKVERKFATFRDLHAKFAVEGAKDFLLIEAGTESFLFFNVKLSLQKKDLTPIKEDAKKKLNASLAALAAHPDKNSKKPPKEVLDLQAKRDAAAAAKAFAEK